tara:strand:- start:2386 stop:3513 length:1128 start_codon:yes stop_codon:yes gene_type:complete
MKKYFLLDSNITFLNHGSFGACPKVVFNNYQYWQRELEIQPVKFFTKVLYEKLEYSRKKLSNFIGCDHDELIFFQNPTTAVSNIIANLDLQSGDEVLMSSHEYGALVRSWTEWGIKKNIKIVQQEVELPLTTENKFIENIWRGITPKTKVVFLSHITSATGLIFPLEKIISLAKEKGIMTIIDGAHAPAHIPLNIHKINCDFYTGALHKWLCGPKGASFLYVKKKHQHWVKPLIYSWGKEGDDPGPSEFLQDFQWQGTRDMAAFLSIPSAIEFYYSYLEKNLKLCRENIKYAFKNLGLTLNTEPISNGGDWIGQMVSHPLPESAPLDLKEILYHHYKIEIPIFKWGDRMFIRVSMQIYNEKKEVDLLLSALSSIF